MSERTRNEIKSVFVKLIYEKPLSKISVKDIAAACGINRNTFYYHYQDVPSLIEEIVRDEVDRVIREYPTVETFDKCLDIVFDFMAGNKRAALHIYNSVNRDIFDNYLWRMCRYVVDKYFESTLAGRNIKAEDKSVLAGFYTCLMFGLIMGWLRDGIFDDIDAYKKRMLELRGGILEEMIDRLDKPKV